MPHKTYEYNYLVQLSKLTQTLLYTSIMGSSSSKNADEYESQIKARYATEMKNCRTDNQKKLCK